MHKVRLRVKVTKADQEGKEVRLKNHLEAQHPNLPARLFTHDRQTISWDSSTGSFVSADLPKESKANLLCMEMHLKGRQQADVEWGKALNSQQVVLRPTFLQCRPHPALLQKAKWSPKIKSSRSSEEFQRVL